MYNPKSLKAEEFISDEEIRETLAYADANKENVALIDQILAKAKECGADEVINAKDEDYPQRSLCPSCLSHS